MLKPSYTNTLTEAGCDEAGRGCLAGPVFAAAVILPLNYENELLNDSKKLSEKHRNSLKEIIIRDALAWAVISLDNNYIDEYNILNASIEAMRQAVLQLKIRPQLLLIDGNRFKPLEDIPHHCIVRGDATYMSIAAASILAKTFRDAYMLEIHNEYPDYGWDKNKGYPTPIHIQAYKKLGLTPYHRKTFRLNEQLKMKF